GGLPASVGGRPPATGDSSRLIRPPRRRPRVVPPRFAPANGHLRSYGHAPGVRGSTDGPPGAACRTGTCDGRPRNVKAAMPRFEATRAGSAEPDGARALQIGGGRRIRPHAEPRQRVGELPLDRKSTRLN